MPTAFTGWTFPANDLGRLRSRGRGEVALQACHPRFFATERWITYARVIDFELT